MRKKITIITVLILTNHLFTACLFRCNCPEPEDKNITFNAFEFEPHSIDLQYNSIDTIYPEKVSFKYTLRDTLLNDFYWVETKENSPIPVFPFIKPAQAFQPCPCPQFNFLPPVINSIRIFTLTKLNEKYPKDSELRSEFLIGEEYSFDNELQLYSTLDEAINKYNNTKDLHEPVYEFNFFLKERAEGDSCRFFIEINFEDNTSLSDTTDFLTVFQE